jgi:hypothetical protein
VPSKGQRCKFTTFGENRENEIKRLKKEMKDGHKDGDTKNIS